MAMLIPDNNSIPIISKLREASTAGKSGKFRMSKGIARATTPTLMKKSHCHELNSMSKPPKTGPNIGPKIIGVVTIAMTLPIFSGPAVLTSKVDIKGVMMPALKPCKRRKKMNRLIFQLNPTRTDVRPKTRTERISTFI